MTPLSLPKLSFRLQMTLVFGTLVAVVTVLLSFAVGELLKSRIREQAEVSLSAISANVTRMLSGELLAGAQEVQKMVGLQAVWARGIDGPEVRQMLATSQANSPGNSWIGVTDAQGVVRAATGDVLVGQNVSQRPWFGPGLQGLYVGDVHPAKLLAKFLPPSRSGEPLRFVDFSVPVQADGKVLGVLAIHGSWDWINGQIETLLPADARGRQLQVFVFDRAGQVIYAPDGKTAPFANLKLPVVPGMGAAFSAPGVSVVEWADGASYLTSIKPVAAQSPASDLGWQVVVREPTALAYAAVRTATWQTLGLGLLAALLGSGLAWLVSGRVSRPLSAMARAAHLVQAGKPGTQIPMLGNSPEMRSLSSSLNTMTNRLLQANESMEATVRQRTAELEAANEELGRLAQSDPLTGLLNRRGFHQLFEPALRAALRGGHALSVAMIDIDHFKRINDRLGHEMGDRVLCGVATMLRERLRASDVVARIGGEEFAVMLPGTDIAGARVIAQALVEGVAAHWKEAFGPVTISVGLAGCGAGVTQPAALLARADAALYEAKGQGRNRVVAFTDIAPPPA